MGAPQLKMEAMKRASLETMVKNAKAAGMFNEEEAKNWRGTKRKDLEETVEAVSEEGDVTGTVSVSTPVPDAPPPVDALHGPLAQWIAKGMPPSEPLTKLGLSHYSITPTHVSAAEAPQSSESISVYTISLPARAPRELLLEIKSIFETFPGPEKIQLKIGGDIVPVGLTVTVSPIFEKHIEETVKKYTLSA
jgi:hypothetical protein